MNEIAYYRIMPHDEVLVRLSTWDSAESMPMDEWNELQRRWIKMGIVVQENNTLTIPDKI